MTSVRRLVQAGYFALIITIVLGLGKVHAWAIGDYDLTSARTFPWFIAFGLLLGLGGYIAGIPDVARSTQRSLVAGCIAVAAAVVGVSFAQAVTATPLLPRFVLMGAPLLIIPTGVIATAVSLWCGQRSRSISRVFVVAGAEDLARLRADIAMLPQPVSEIVEMVEPVEMVGTLRSSPLVHLATEQQATLLVLSRHAQDDESIVAQAATLHASGVRVRTLSKFYEENLAKLPLAELERVALMFDISEVHPGVYPRFKRALDIAVGSAGVLALAVVTPLIWVANAAANRGPLFYRQERVGRSGTPFTILKFRSMRPDAGASTWTQVADNRVTRFGHLLRISHVDELPQMVNILRGDLSIVGPRPEQTHYVEELSGKLPFYDLRHLVRPGLTGWAQVMYGYGGSESDALEKLQYEFYYLRHQSLRLDLSIMVRTARKLFAAGNR